MMFLLSLLVGCGLSEEDYTDQAIQLTCEQAIECYDAATLEMMGWSDQSSCESSLTALMALAEDSECEYDGKAAAACLDEQEALTCDDIMAGSIGDSCDSVCV